MHAGGTPVQDLTQATILEVNGHIEAYFKTMRGIGGHGLSVLVMTYAQVGLRSSARNLG